MAVCGISEWLYPRRWGRLVPLPRHRASRPCDRVHGVGGTVQNATGGGGRLSREVAAHAHPVVRVPAVLLWRGLDRWTEDHEHHAHPPAVARPDLDELREVGALRRRARRVHARSACPNVIVLGPVAHHRYLVVLSQTVSDHRKTR